MKGKLSIVVIGFLFAGLALTTAAFAQSGNGRGGWGPGSRYGRMYNPATVETIAGEVISVDRFTPARGMSTGIHLMVKTDKATISVHLGPAWFIDKQSLKIEPKDTVKVTGSRITFDGKPAIIAAEVQKDGNVLKLREGNGMPVWSGWRRRSR